MSKITAEVKLTIDSKAAQNMLLCAGYGDEKRSNSELVQKLLSILEDYGVTSTVVSVKNPENNDEAKPQTKVVPIFKQVKMERKGNKLNSLNHILALCKRCKTADRYWEIVNKMSDRGIYNVFENRCDLCSHDDFGECLLPYSDDTFVSGCLPALISALERELEKYKK